MCDFNKMKWYFFYTPNYHFYKNHIINRISNHFDTKPLEIPQLKLANPDEKGHHFANITLIEDAVTLWEKLKVTRELERWRPDNEVRNLFFFF